MPRRLGRAYGAALARLTPDPDGVEASDADWGGVKGIATQPSGHTEGPRLVYLHGGAYCFGSARTHRALTCHLALAMDCGVFSVDYRLAPENPYPAALEDALTAYRAVASGGQAPLLAGDSAGGGLALSAAIALRDAGEPEQPPGLLLISPLVDLTGSGESRRTNDRKDALLRNGSLSRNGPAYAGGIDLADPRVSPINADLAGLPPTLIQAGTHELLLSEGTELAARMQAAGTPSELQTFDGMWHDFQLHAGMMRESDEAVAKIGVWAKPLLSA